MKPGHTFACRQLAALVLCVGLGLSVAQQTNRTGTATTPPPPRFQSAIRAFLAQDQTNPPPRQAILFIGSSIFRQWTNVAAQMSPLPVFNRAFGGSRTTDILQHMDKVVLPYEPRIIVYYCGSNDVNGGEPAEAIADRFRQFVARVQERLPATRFIYVSINRAPQKQERWTVVDTANRLVREYCGTDQRLAFVDVNAALFDPSGNARLELFRPDKLHLKPAAYEGFAAILKPEIEKAWREAQAGARSQGRREGAH